MATNATISCPQFTHVPVDFFGAVGDSAVRRLVGETRKPDRRAHVKHMAQLAIVAGLASSLEEISAVSFTVLKDGSIRIGFMKNLNTNPWTMIEANLTRMDELILENMGLRMDISKMKMELEKLRAVTRDYEGLAEEYIKEALNTEELIAISAVRAFAERLTK